MRITRQSDEVLCAEFVRTSWTKSKIAKPENTGYHPDFEENGKHSSYGDYSPSKIHPDSVEARDPRDHEHNKFQSHEDLAKNDDHNNAAWDYDDFGSEINRSLRAGHETTQTKHLDDMIGSSKPSSSPSVHYRGVAFPHKMFGKPGSMVGKSFHDKGYTSTSSSLGIAHSYGELGHQWSDEKHEHNEVDNGPGVGVLVHHLPAGHKAMAFRYDGGTEEENQAREVVHPRGTKWKVMADYHRGDHREIHLHPES